MRGADTEKKNSLNRVVKIQTYELVITDQTQTSDGVVHDIFRCSGQYSSLNRICMWIDNLFVALRRLLLKLSIFSCFFPVKSENLCVMNYYYLHASIEFDFTITLVLTWSQPAHKLKLNSTQLKIHIYTTCNSYFISILI